jgi:hypothetical protein
MFFDPAHSKTHARPVHAELVDLVDFKWLMAAEGRRVHIERLQADRVYATGCLTAALASSSDTLRRCARQLQACLCN